MRITAERQAARVRIAKADLAIAEAIDELDCTPAELMMALLQAAHRLQNELIIQETPLDNVT